MSKHVCFDEKERICLLQVHSLLNNLEALSQDQEISFDDESIKSIAVSTIALQVTGTIMFITIHCNFSFVQNRKK